jgi:hypothetical protein
VIVVLEKTGSKGNTTTAGGSKTLSAITAKRGPLDLQTLYAPVQGNARAKKGNGWVGECGVGMGDFWDSIGNVMRKIPNKKKRIASIYVYC